MKKRISIACMLLLLGATLLSLVSCGDQEKVIVQTNAFFAPFEYYEGTEIRGVDVDIMEQVGKNLGQDIEFVNVEFSAIVDNVKDGVVCDAGAAGITVTEERSAKVDFSIPYYTSVQYVIMAAGNQAIATRGEGSYVVWEALSGKTVGTQIDTTGWIFADGELAEGGAWYETGTTLKTYDTVQLAADAIGARAVDAVIVDELPAKYIAEKSGGAYICLPLYYSGADGEADTPVSEEYAICVTRGNTELLNAINAVLEELLVEDESGESGIDRLVMKHMGLETEQKHDNKLIELFSNPAYMNSIWQGLRTTLIISVAAALLGLLLGALVAMVGIAKNRGPMRLLKLICNVYIAVVRGTPMALQLFIMAYVVFAIRGFPQIITAIIAFGINSGAYVAENIRAGILSVDRGQTEAGRALGLSSRVTMLRIVIPQAIKNVIPAIGNELIALIKETSIVSMIGMFDLTMAAKIIGSGNNMASYLVPMAVVALFYLAIVYLLTFVIKQIERRLRAGDQR